MLGQTTMEFEQRLEKAIERGKRVSDARARADAERALTEAELRRLHTQYRLQLSDRIESTLRKLPQHVPGFRFDTVVSERGWGATLSRDDFVPGGQGRRNQFSRLEMLIRPISDLYVLEVTGKGTVRNKEVFSRGHFEKLADVDLGTFEELVDRWTLEYAEMYAASR